MAKKGRKSEEKSVREKNKWQEYEKRTTKINFKMCAWNVISGRSDLSELRQVGCQDTTSLLSITRSFQQANERRKKKKKTG